MIFRYTFKDILGNHLELMVQSTSRGMADIVAVTRAQERGKLMNYHWEKDFTVKDVSDEPVLHEELFDHEMGLDGLTGGL